LVEKGPILGGMPVRYEEMFPKMECGPCLMEPIMAEVLHGPHAQHIELLLLSEVVEVVGSFGNYSVKVKKSPRYVDLATCVGCAACIETCPASLPNPVNCNLSTRKAMDFAFFGGLPNAPFIDAGACVRLNGSDESCNACQAACPVEGAVKLDDRDEIVEHQVGAIVVAVGSTLFDCEQIPQLGYGKLSGVVTSLEFERLAASSGPTSGEIRLPDGRVPERVAIVHCVGSLDAEHNPYCSGICCMTAFKFNKLLVHKVPGAKVSHFFKTLVAPGKDEHELYVHATTHATLTPYQDIRELRAEQGPNGHITLHAKERREDFDLVVLMPAIVASDSAKRLGKILEAGFDGHGFFEELHGRVDATKSKNRGVYLAGTCQAPMELGRAMTQGSSAAGNVMAALVPGRKLVVEAIHAEVDVEACSGCRSCISVCPYKAISFDVARAIAEVNPIRCVGCGTCVAACPASVIKGKHFSNEQIFAEIEGILT
jgi:heterodisulfide reductase subunit A